MIEIHGRFVTIIRNFEGGGLRIFVLLSKFCTVVTFKKKFPIGAEFYFSQKELLYTEYICTTNSQMSEMQLVELVGGK